MKQVKEILKENSIYYKESNNDYVIHCLNPEHEDTHPSLHIDKETGVFHCWSCNYKGDIYSFFGEIKDLKTLKVFTILKEIEKNRNKQIEIPKGSTSIKMESFRGIPRNVLNKFGAFLHVQYYPDRIVFPVKDSNGDTVGLIGRTYSKESTKPKYMTWPKNVTFPLFPAMPIDRKTSSVVLVEGIFDFLNLYSKGLVNCQAILGNNTLLGKGAKYKISPLKILGINRIFLLFDSGAEKEAERTKKVLEKDFICEILDISKYQRNPEENPAEDPGDFMAGQVKVLQKDIQ